jgi:hypothetical protein
MIAWDLREDRILLLTIDDPNQRNTSSRARPAIPLRMLLSQLTRSSARGRRRPSGPLTVVDV